MKTTLETEVKRAAIIRAAGFPVRPIPLVNSNRCGFEHERLPEIDALLDDFERRRVLPLSAKAILNAYSSLLHEAKQIKGGAAR